MFILPSAEPDAPGAIFISASDVVAADACGFAAVRKLDALLGRIDTVPAKRDAMMDLTAALGEKHEREILDGLKVRYGSGVYELPVIPGSSRPTLERRHRDTLAALAGGNDVIYQGAFFDGSFHGRADFLIRGTDGRWIVHDTKLARSAKGAALLQLAAYADQLQAAGVPVHDEVRLILGDGTTTSHDLAEPAAAYRKARAHLQCLLAQHRADHGPAEFRGDFAASTQDPDADKLGRALWLQARMQTGKEAGDGGRNGVTYKVTGPDTLDTIPAPDEGDIFFDFEGDPNWQDPATGAWGIEYLFGLLEHPDERFIPFTAHTIAQERQAFTDFMEHVAARRRTYPGLHIYHYAAYEVTALKRLSARHGIYAAEVAELIDSGVLFDLLKVVRAALVTSQRSFSIKKMEPLYMPDHREGVATAVDSLIQYALYGRAAAAGDAAGADRIFTSILDYNRYDCLSTLKLRDWLLSLLLPVTTPAA